MKTSKEIVSPNLIVELPVVDPAKVDVIEPAELTGGRAITSAKANTIGTTLAASLMASPNALIIPLPYHSESAPAFESRPGWCRPPPAAVSAVSSPNTVQSECRDHGLLEGRAPRTPGGGPAGPPSCAVGPAVSRPRAFRARGSRVAPSSRPVLGRRGRGCGGLGVDGLGTIRCPRSRVRS